MTRPAGRAPPGPESGVAGVRRSPEDLRRGRLVGFQLRCRRAQRRRRKGPALLALENKEDLLLSALSAHYRSISIRDSGNLRDDLIEYTARLLESKASPDGWAFLRIHLEATVIPALQARFSSQIAIPHVEGARALLHRAVDSGELPAEAPVDLLLDSLYGAIVIKMILSPPGQRAQLAAEPHRYAAPIVDFVLSGLPGARTTGVVE